MTGVRGRLPVGLVLFLCLLAAQAGVLALSPILHDVARDFHVSTATAGQLRSFSGVVAGLAAIAMARVARRLGLRDTITGGLAFLAVGSVLSAIAPHFAVLAIGQVFIGLCLAVILSAGLAAAGEWAPAEKRSRVLAWALVGPPSAWIIGLPIIAAVAGHDWRYAWLALPFAASIVAFVAIRTRPPH